MTVRTLFLLLTTGLLYEGVAGAQSPDGINEPRLTRISYPVADLVIPISPLHKGETIVTSESELMSRIREKIAPGTWEEAGGGGSMQFFRDGYVLIINQTPAVHAELKAYLKQLQREQVSVEVRIVSLSEKTMEQMDRSQIRWAEKNGMQSAILDDLQTFRLLEAVQGDRRAHVMQMPKITLFEGQQGELRTRDLKFVMIGVDFQEKDRPPVVRQKEVFVGIQASFLSTISSDKRQITVQTEISITREEPSRNEFKLAFAAKVPDQKTVAILAGKIVSEEKIEENSPMSRIPYVGRMFRNVGYSRETMTQIVLLTPRIIREQEVAEVQPLRTRIQPENDGKFPLIRSQEGQK